MSRHTCCEPRAGQLAITTKLADYTVQMGGRLKKDKAFFFASIQRYQATPIRPGRSPLSEDISPRFNTKFTLAAFAERHAPARHAGPTGITYRRRGIPRI